MHITRQSAALAAVLVLSAVSAEAQSAEAPAGTPTPFNGMVEFFGCDGFGPPGPNGDGMTEWAGGSAGLFKAWIPGNTIKNDVRVGSEGVRFCDAALASSSVQGYFLRRVDLLLARAVHKLAIGDGAGAKADVAAAREEAGPRGGALYDRSLGLGADFVEAYALALDGQGSEAVERVRRAYERRPYSRRSAIAALMVIEAVGQEAETEAMLRALARLHPAALDELYLTLLHGGRWEQAVALYPQLTGPRDTSDNPRSGMDKYPALRSRLKTETYWLSRGAWRAYALAAAGKPAEARTALAAARERLTAASAVPVPHGRKRPGESNGKRFEYETQLNAKLRASGGALLDGWAPLVEARVLLAEGDTAGALALAMERDARRMAPERAAWADLLQALRERLPAADKDPVATSPTRGAASVKHVDLGAFLQALPEAERPESLPRYDAKISGMDGWSIKVEAAGASLNFRDKKATAPEVVAEAVLLRAADLALAAGKPGLIITAREDVRHTESEVSLGITGPQVPMGYSTRLQVLFVDPSALPQGYEDAGWRVLDAAAVRAALAPVYALRG